MGFRFWLDENHSIIQSVEDKEMMVLLVGIKTHRALFFNLMLETLKSELLQE